MSAVLRRGFRKFNKILIFEFCIFLSSKMSKVLNVNSSLAYEILFYLNSFYIGMFIVCEVAIGVLKVCNMNYPENARMNEATIFGILCLVEVTRIFLGRKGDLVTGSKSNKKL